MKRRHNAQFWLLMTGLAVVGGGSLVGFKYSGLSGERAHTNALQAQTQDQSQVQAALLKSQQDLDTAKASLTHLEQGIPTTAYVPTMLQQLQATGQGCGISVTGVRPAVKQGSQSAAASSGDDGSQKLAKPAYQEMDIDVKGRGTYASAMKFVKALETFPKIVGVRTVEITPAMDPKEQEAGLVDITIGLAAYLFADSGDAANASAAAGSTANASTAAPADAGKAVKAGDSKAAAPAGSVAKDGKTAAPAAGDAKPADKAVTKTASAGKEGTA